MLAVACSCVCSTGRIAPEIPESWDATPAKTVCWMLSWNDDHAGPSALTSVTTARAAGASPSMAAVSCSCVVALMAPVAASSCCAAA